MRHTLLATSLFRLALGTAILLRPAQSEERVLDLTKTPSAGHRSLGVPGSVGGGVIGVASISAQAYPLPIEIRITDVTLSSKDPRRILRLKIEITNKGHAVFDLPSCVDEQSAHSPEYDGRRTFQFGAEFWTPKAKSLLRKVLDVTYSAASNPACSIAIQPDEKVLAVLETDVPRELLNSTDKVPLIEVRALCSEWTLEDGRFFIKQSSQEVRSDLVKAKGK